LKAGELLSRISVGRAVLIGMLIAAFYYFLVFDNGMAQQEGINQGRAKVAELQAQLVDYQQKLDSAAVYKKTAAEVGNTINKLLTLIPEKFGMSDLMKIVSNEAKVAGSSLMKIEPKSTNISPVAGEFEELILTIELQGSFLQHMVFLSNLTKIQQILIIRKFDMIHSRDGKGDESPTVTLNAEIAAFRYRGIDANKAPPPPPGGQVK
jgi:Tfp pilus assembly protein PilO